MLGNALIGNNCATESALFNISASPVMGKNNMSMTWLDFAVKVKLCVRGGM